MVEFRSEDIVPLSSASPGSQIIRKVLAPAVQLWLRTQVETIHKLQFQIEGSDRQILRGQIPRVSVLAEKAVYQGLHLSFLDLAATQIRVNVGQLLKGKPLRLLAPVPVTGQVQLLQTDLEASATAPLLQQALIDVLKLLMAQIPAADPAQVAAPELTALRHHPFGLHQPQIDLAPDQLKLSAQLHPASGSPLQVVITTRLQLSSPRHLQLEQITLHYQLLSAAEPKVVAVPPMQLDLGSEVQLQQLKIDGQQIFCQGQINVLPG